MSQTPEAEATSTGYCANTCAWKSRAAGALSAVRAGALRAARLPLAEVLFFAMTLLSGPARRRLREPRALRESEQAVHPLHRAAGGALDEIVDGAHDGDGAAVGGRREVRVVAGGDFLDVRRALTHPHERRARVVLLQRAAGLARVECPSQARLHRDMNAAREGTGVRHEGELHLDAARRAGAGDDLRRVAVLQGVVAVEIAVAQRMVRTLDRLASRARAAGDAAHVQVRLDEAEGEQRHRGEQYRGGEAARVGDVRRGELREVLGHRTAEFLQARRRAVRVAVNVRVAFRGGVAEIGGDVDHARLGPGARARAE